MSSLAFDVSIPAVVMLVCVIFFDPCLVKRTKCSGNHPGPRKVLARSRYKAAKKRLRAGYDPIASGLSRIAAAAGHSFRNAPTIIVFCYYKGGLGEAVTHRSVTVDYALANPPYEISPA